MQQIQSNTWRDDVYEELWYEWIGSHLLYITQMSFSMSVCAVCVCVLCNRVHTICGINPQLTCFESLLAEEDRADWASVCRGAAISCHVGLKSLGADCSNTQPRQQGTKQLWGSFSDATQQLHLCQQSARLLPTTQTCILWQLWAKVSEFQSRWVYMTFFNVTHAKSKAAGFTDMITECQWNRACSGCDVHPSTRPHHHIPQEHCTAAQRSASQT